MMPSNASMRCSSLNCETIDVPQRVHHTIQKRTLLPWVSFSDWYRRYMCLAMASHTWHLMKGMSRGSAGGVFVEVNAEA